MDTVMSVGVLYFGIILIPAFLFFAGVFLFWLATLVDILKRDFEKDGDKIVWVLVVLFLGVIGSIIYTLVKKPDLGGLGKAGKYLAIAGLVLFILGFLLMFVSITTTIPAAKVG